MFKHIIKIAIAVAVSLVFNGAAYSQTSGWWFRSTYSNADGSVNTSGWEAILTPCSLAKRSLPVTARLSTDLRFLAMLSILPGSVTSIPWGSFAQQSHTSSSRRRDLPISTLSSRTSWCRTVSVLAKRFRTAGYDGVQVRFTSARWLGRGGEQRKRVLLVDPTSQDFGGPPPRDRNQDGASVSRIRATLSSRPGSPMTPLASRGGSP